MADVYGGAFLTISAAASPSVHHGLHQSCESHFSDSEYRILRQIDNPLYHSGWALQERILSRRVLIFGNIGLYWECQAFDSNIYYRKYNFFPAIEWEVGVRL